MDIFISIDILPMYRELVVVLAVFCTAPAYAAQLDADILGDEIEPEFRFLRVVTIEHPDGGQLAELLGDAGSVSLAINSTGSDGLAAVFNRGIQEELSTATVEGVVLKYRATISPQPQSTTIEYKIDLVPVLSGTASSNFVDFQWRGFDIAEPVMVPTRHGEHDINSPASVLQALAPLAYEKLERTDADRLLSAHLLDASGLRTPLADWDFLFDPIGRLIPDMAIDTVVSQYSLGACKITDRQICKDKSHDVDIQLDKKYTVRSTESKDDATVTLLGYTKVTSIRGLEYFERIPEAAAGPIEDLSVLMIYGMAGVASAAGGMFFIVSGRKSRKEEGMGQTGIDPANLVSYDTSAGSGAYHTNRGESVVRGTAMRSAV